MKKLITGVALAALLVVTAGYAADEFVPRRSGSSAEWGFNSSDEVRIQRMTDDGKSIVEACMDTTTAAVFVELVATSAQIDWRLNTGTGYLKDISEELTAQSKQLGVIEGAGTTGTAHLSDIKDAVEGTGASAQEVQGPVANGATWTGASNPFMVGGLNVAAQMQAFHVSTSGLLGISDKVTGADNWPNASMGLLQSDSGNNGVLTGFALHYLDGANWDRGRGSAEFGLVVDARETTGGARAVPNENAPDYFFDRYPDVAVAEQLLVAGQATLKPRVLEWEITVVDGDASGTLHFTDTEVTGDSSNVFGHFDSSSQGGAIRPGDDWSPLLWGTVNIPIYMNVEARSNTFTTVKARLVSRQE